MKKLQYLTIEEQKNIQGGDWIKELGRNAQPLLKNNNFEEDIFTRFCNIVYYF